MTETDICPTLSVMSVSHSGRWCCWTSNWHMRIAISISSVEDHACGALGHHAIG
jgi:hypothetical protein